MIGGSLTKRFGSSLNFDQVTTVSQLKPAVYNTCFPAELLAKLDSFLANVMTTILALTALEPIRKLKN